MYGRLSETYDAAESVPTQLERGTDHATRRGWQVVATFKDDGYSAFKEITRDGFGELIAAIEAGQVDVVIVRDIDRLTRNLTDWNAFEKACVRHGVRLSAYTGGDLDLSTPEGAYYGGMETLRAKRESAVKSFRVREAHDRNARAGKRAGGGWRWFGYTRIYANPAEADPHKRAILREDINQAGSGRDPRCRGAAAGARGIGPVDHAGLDRARDQAGSGQAVVSVHVGRHDDLAASGRVAGMAGPQVPGAVAGDPRRRYA